VERNSAKRRMREAIRPLIPYMWTGWDVLLIARRPLQKASFQALQTALKTLLNRAKLLKPSS
jgi:ribonuclease P protein component